LKVAGIGGGVRLFHSFAKSLKERTGTAGLCASDNGKRIGKSFARWNRHGRFVRVARWVKNRQIIRAMDVV
jgi:hypothetical protein